MRKPLEVNTPGNNELFFSKRSTLYNLHCMVADLLLMSSMSWTNVILMSIWGSETSGGLCESGVESRFEGVLIGCDWCALNCDVSWDV